MPVRVRAAIPYALIAVFGAALAYFSLFSQFTPHDDSGHLSVSLTEFIAGRNLYEDLYSQYGPLYFLLFGGLFSIPGIELTTDSVRLLTLVLWVICGLLLGLSAERITGDRRLGWIASIGAFAGLTALAPEPMHPVGISTTLTCAIIAILAFGAERPPMRVAVPLGIAVGALAMIKINMGALAAVALIAAVLISLSPPRLRIAYAIGAAALVSAATLVLLSNDLGVGWVQELIALQLAGTFAIVVRAVAARGAGESPDGSWLWIGRFAAAGMAVVVVVSLLIFALGTTPAGLVDGVLIDPTRHPDIDVLQFTFHSKVIAGSLIVLAAVVALTLWRDRLGNSTAVLAVRAAVRFVAAVAILASIVQQTQVYFGPSARTVTIGVLVAWLAAVPPREAKESASRSFARLAIVLFAVVEVLQAYPVAGSQLKAASVLFVVVALILVADGLRVLKELPAAVRLPTFAAPAAIAALGAYLAIAGVLIPLKDTRARWHGGTPLDQRGAKLVRVPGAQAAAYHQIVDGAARYGCKPIVMLPGAYSLQGWFGQRPPSGYNVSNWMLLVSKKRQREVVAKVRDKPRLCVVRIDDPNFDYVAISVPPLITKPLFKYLTTTPLKTVVETSNGANLIYRLQVRPEVARELEAR
jgi:hypothetical protein